MKRLMIGLVFLLGGCATPAPPMPSVPLPPQAPPGEPADLIGLPEANIRGFFGTPAFVRTENGAEIWRYDGAQCRAFFFFYPKGASLVVRHVETVPRGAEIAADPNCLAALRGRPPAS